MKTLRNFLDKALASMLATLMAAMVVNVLWQVATRYLLKSPSAWTEELARYMMIWLGLLGAAYATGQRAHLAIDFFTCRLTGARKAASETLIYAIILFFAVGVLVLGGGRLVKITLALNQTSAALGWKMGWVYLALPLCGALIALYSACFLVETLGKRNAPAQPTGGAAS